MNNDLTIIKQNGGAYLDSREVAEVIGKRHYDLCRDIARYERIMEKITERKIPFSDFFIESSYMDSTGRTLPCYLVSKSGAEVLANKLTGEKGVRFTFAYVSKFNAMEATEREAEIKAYAKPRLSEFNSAAKTVLSGMAYCHTTPFRVMDFLHDVYKPLGIEVGTDCDYLGYYSATEIAEITGVYSETGRLHSHAVTAIISKLDNLADHVMVVPYGLVGVMLRYDRHIIDAVDDWLESNDYPSTVSYLDFQYHISYDFQMPPLSSSIATAA